MKSISRTRLPSSVPILTRTLLHQRRATTTSLSQAKSRKEGDISSVFVSLSGGAAPCLPARFSDVKRQIVVGREEEISASWRRLLKALAEEVNTIASRGPSIIPTIKYQELEANLLDFHADLKKRGVAVIRNVVPPSEARAYKEDVERYVDANPSTKAFPQHDPQVFELYWSAPQIQARAHPNLLRAQRLLMNAWHSKDPNALISTSSLISYADRLRIRQPGDAGFALGPHMDGGSVERWEKNGYGLSDVYDKIWDGDWENYDPWESSSRLPVVSDLYEGAGGCSMFRMFQGWLSMSRTKPGEGTLQVNPMVKLTTAYTLLRPFFRAIRPFEVDSFGKPTAEYLDAANWTFDHEYTPTLQGATPGHGQELNDELHPHLQLSKSMVNVPKIEPGDYVAWHCDSKPFYSSIFSEVASSSQMLTESKNAAIHAVDKIHNGKTDSSVLYIPACPLTESNARYLGRQRDTFLEGTPGPDFPGGRGESDHIGRVGVNDIKEIAETEGLQAMGLEKWPEDLQNLQKGERMMLSKANHILGFGASL